ncbi:hypothetical protein PCE1_002074 [Barthelona sp. PCE]
MGHANYFFTYFVMRVLLFVLVLTTACLVQGSILSLDIGDSTVRSAVLKRGSAPTILLTKSGKRDFLPFIGIKDRKRHFGREALGLINKGFTVLPVQFDLLDPWLRKTYTPVLDRMGLGVRSRTFENDEYGYETEDGYFTVESLCLQFIDFIITTAEKQEVVDVIVVSTPKFYSNETLARISGLFHSLDKQVVFIDRVSAAGLSYLTAGTKANNESLIIFDISNGFFELNSIDIIVPKRDPKAKVFSPALGELKSRTLISHPLGAADALLKPIRLHVCDDLQGYGACHSEIGARQLAYTIWKAVDRLNAITPLKSSFVFQNEMIDISLDRGAALRTEEGKAFGIMLENIIEYYKEEIETHDITFPIGPGTRVPEIRQLLEESMVLRSGINAEESVALGALYYGAQFNSRYRTRKFTLDSNYVTEIHETLAEMLNGTKYRPSEKSVNDTLLLRNIDEVFEQLNDGLNEIETIYYDIDEFISARSLPSHQLSGVRKNIKIFNKKFGFGKLEADMIAWFNLEAEFAELKEQSTVLEMYVMDSSFKLTRKEKELELEELLTALQSKHQFVEETTKNTTLTYKAIKRTLNSELNRFNLILKFETLLNKTQRIITRSETNVVSGIAMYNVTEKQAKVVQDKLDAVNNMWNDSMAFVNETVASEDSFYNVSSGTIQRRFRELKDSVKHMNTEIKKRVTEWQSSFFKKQEKAKKRAEKKKSKQKKKKDKKKKNNKGGENDIPESSTNSTTETESEAPSDVETE